MRHLLTAAIVLFATIAHAQQAQPLLRQPDLTYLGKFRAPASDGSGRPAPVGAMSDSAAGAMGMTADGLGLYWGCHMHRLQVGAITIPTVLDGRTATVKYPCQVIPGSAEANLNALNPGEPNAERLKGALEFGGRLFVSAYSYYDGNGTATGTHLVGSSLPNLSGTPIKVGTPGQDKLGTPGLIAGYHAHVPASWRALIGAPVLVGLGGVAVISRSSYGLSINAWDPAGTATTALVGYPEAHQTFGPWNVPNPYFTGVTEFGGLAWPDGYRTVFGVGRIGERFCYGTGTGDPSLDGKPDGQGNVYCYDKTDHTKGSHGFPYRHRLWAYDALDLLKVKAGTLKPWDVRPYAWWNLDEMVQGSGEATITGTVYDPGTRRLFISYGGTVHVYAVKDAGGTVPPPPPPAPIDCQGVWSESLSEPTPLVCDAADPFQTRIRTKTFTVTTPPSNGGQACPASPVVTTEKTACTPPPPPPPPPTPKFVGAIRAQEQLKTGVLRVTLEVPKAQAIPGKGAKVDVPLPAGVVVHGTVYGVSTYANGNWRVTLTLPSTSALTLGVEVPVQAAIPQQR